jgi:hypothetical protein
MHLAYNFIFEKALGNDGFRIQSDQKPKISEDKKSIFFQNFPPETPDWVKEKKIWKIRRCEKMLVENAKYRGYAGLFYLF